MSSLKTKRIQLGSHATPENNFGIVQPDTPDGTLRVGQGNLGSLTELLKLDISALDVLTGLKVDGDVAAEYGSDPSNGEYVRFYNGVQVCWNNRFLTSYYSDSQFRGTWSYPAAFVDTPALNGFFSNYASDATGVSYVELRTLMAQAGVSSCTFRVILTTASATTDNNIEVSGLAIGRWK